MSTPEEKETDLSIKLQRTVNAAYHALLEMSAFLGIPEHKRAKQIEQQMENVRYCAEHDLRHIDEFVIKKPFLKRISELEAQNKELIEVLEFYADEENYKRRYAGHGQSFGGRIFDMYDEPRANSKRAREVLEKAKN